jgi:hypothetical protein
LGANRKDAVFLLGDWSYLMLWELSFKAKVRFDNLYKKVRAAIGFGISGSGGISI